MSSSVSSERAFSSAGITISKRRNCLKGDIVEALQCLKCMIHRNLIFRQDPAISVADEIAEEDDTPTDIGDEIQVLLTKERPLKIGVICGWYWKTAQTTLKGDSDTG
jgi:hypothetical protein